MENDNKIKIKKIETYADDMVRAIEDDKSGLIRKIIHEEEEHEEERRVSTNSKKSRVQVILSFLFLVSAFGILVLLFLRDDIPNTSVVSEPQQIVFTDKTRFISVDDMSVDQVISTFSNQIKNSSVNVGGIEGISLTENGKVIGFNRFNTLLKTSLDLNNKVVKNDFLLGAYNDGLSSLSVRLANPFLVLKVSSFTDSFTFMCEWENKILHDLGGLFGIKLTPDTNYLFTKDFEDYIVVNKNARVLYSKYGDIVMMYVFVDDNTVIIANSDKAVDELISRLSSGKIKK